MTEQQAIEVALETWDREWALRHPGSSAPADIAQAGCVPWCTRNEAYELAELGPLGCWARINLQHTTRQQITQGAPGARKYECRGYVFVNLFGPVDQGDTTVAGLADDVRKALQGKTIDVAGEFTIFAGRTSEVDDDTGAWSGRTVVLPFRYVAIE